MGPRPSTVEKLLAFSITIIAALSPLYVGQKPAPKAEPQAEESKFSILPLLLLILIVCINLSRCFDRRLTRLDPYWIHRAGGSSLGIVAMLSVLFFVLKFKTSLEN
ncbi:hypothetical protein AMTRI_Chr04g180220 [Amborella trichopoda]